jgi:hypothetical protein
VCSSAELGEKGVHSNWRALVHVMLTFHKSRNNPKLSRRTPDTPWRRCGGCRAGQFAIRSSSQLLNRQAESLPLGTKPPTRKATIAVQEPMGYRHCTPTISPSTEDDRRVDLKLKFPAECSLCHMEPAKQNSAMIPAVSLGR